MKNIIIAFALLAFYSCDDLINEKIDGNGSLAEETRTVDNFTTVEISGAYEVDFIQDSGNKVEIEAESNFMDYIEVYVIDGKLVIENKKGIDFRSNYPIEIDVYHSGLNAVNFSGAGSMDLGIMETQTLNVNLSGAGEIEGELYAGEIRFDISGVGDVEAKVFCTDLEAYLSGTGNFHFEGRADKSNFDVSGVGDFEAEHLSVKNSYNTISGTGNVYITVSDLLKVDVSGTGNIYYWGNPELELNISGTGKVNRQDS